MHKCRGVDHYQQECPRDTYRKKVFDYVSNRRLPLNPVSTSGPPGSESLDGNNSAMAAAQREWVAEICPVLREKRFQESLFWNKGGETFPIRRTRTSLFDKKED